MKTYMRRLNRALSEPENDDESAQQRERTTYVTFADDRFRETTTSRFTFPPIHPIARNNGRALGQGATKFLLDAPILSGTRNA